MATNINIGGSPVSVSAGRYYVPLGGYEYGSFSFQVQSPSSLVLSLEWTNDTVNHSKLPWTVSNSVGDTDYAPTGTYTAADLDVVHGIAVNCNYGVINVASGTGTLSVKAGEGYKFL